MFLQSKQRKWAADFYTNNEGPNVAEKKLSQAKGTKREHIQYISMRAVDQCTQSCILIRMLSPAHTTRTPARPVCVAMILTAMHYDA